MEVIGTIKAINPTEKVSDRFQKREFVVTTIDNPEYPQHLLIQLTQDKCNVLDQYEIGQNVKVQINLKGREFNGPQGIKYFNTIEAWKIDKTT